MNSDYKIKYSDTGKLVYFEADVKELFNVDLSTPGVIVALNYAFNVSKSAVPVKTGLMLRSYRIDKISNTTVRCYFDPKRIIGKKRLGKVVKEYYPQYLVRYPSRLNWLDIVIKRFYETLKIEMGKLAKTNEKIDQKNFNQFFLLLIATMNQKTEQEKKFREEQEKRQELLKQRRKRFLKSLNKGGK